MSLLHVVLDIQTTWHPCRDFLGVSHKGSRERSLPFFFGTETEKRKETEENEKKRKETARKQKTRKKEKKRKETEENGKKKRKKERNGKRKKGKKGR